jgi:3-dehydroquinate synthase
LFVEFNYKKIKTQIDFSLNLEQGSLFWEELVKKSLPILIVIENSLISHFQDPILQALSPHKEPVFLLSLPGGEGVKTEENKQKIERFLFEKGFGKNSCLLGVGGGALLDLVGFTASTYARGIFLAFLPTTLLSMVDACLGGKTAINAFNIKNFLGSFYPASKILISLDFLQTLPFSHKKSALAEVIKHGVIFDEELLHFLQKNKALWLKEDPEFLTTMIEKSLMIKKSIVEKDPQEEGLRRILNFGHTMGHAIEAFFSYKISHGEAVSIGMLLEAHISMQMGFLPEKDLSTLYALWKDFGFEKKPWLFTYQDLLPYLLFDKKNTKKVPKFVIVSSLGNVDTCDGAYCTEAKEETMQEAIHWFQKRDL